MPIDNKYETVALLFLTLTKIGLMVGLTIWLTAGT